MASFDLDGRTALVTGGFSGLGLHFARVLAAHGAKIALVGRRIDLGRSVAQEIGASVGRPGEVRAYEADVTTADSVARAFAAATADLGVPVDRRQQCRHRGAQAQPRSDRGRMGRASSTSTSPACSGWRRRQRGP